MVLTVVGNTVAGEISTYLDGVFQVSRPYPTAQYAQANFTDMYVGYVWYGNSNSLDGYLPEMIFYDSALNSVDVGTLHQYLINKHDIVPQAQP